jgi:hypothetical protein
MKSNEFINNYDFKGSIILLEGKRNVKPDDKNLLIKLGTLLTSKAKHITFRSGNAPGADELFCEGVSLVDRNRIQLIIPNKEHRKKNRIGMEAISLDEINLLCEPEIVYQSKSNLKTKNLVERYVNGHRDSVTCNAGYIIRDTIKVLGTQSIPPANFGIFYDDLEKPCSGGTGHTMNVCKQNNVPYINQTAWKEWVI